MSAKINGFISSGARWAKFDPQEAQIQHAEGGKRSDEAPCCIWDIRRPNRPRRRQHGRMNPIVRRILNTADPPISKVNTPKAVPEFSLCLQAASEPDADVPILGAAYYAQGMYTRRLGAYERMIELNPEDEAYELVAQSKPRWVRSLRVDRGIYLHRLNGQEVVINSS